LPIPKCGETANVGDSRFTISSARVKSSQTRILVVDDEEYVRDLLRDILEKEGCEAIVAEG
jgi:PleD family two-component response regulator